MVNPHISSRPGVTATADMTVLPGVLGCSFDRLRTGSPCDVLFKYASAPIPCGYPARGASACAARGTPIFTVSQRCLVKYAGLPEDTFTKSFEGCPAISA